MKTCLGGTPAHPVDLMEDFWGRISVFNALGMAALEKASGGGESDACPTGLAHGLVMLARDYDQMQTAIHEWLDAQKLS